jgi:hypothetical protein
MITKMCAQEDYEQKSSTFPMTTPIFIRYLQAQIRRIVQQAGEYYSYLELTREILIPACSRQYPQLQPHNIRTMQYPLRRLVRRCPKCRELRNTYKMAEVIQSGKARIVYIKGHSPKPSPM